MTVDDVAKDSLASVGIPTGIVKGTNETDPRARLFRSLLDKAVEASGGHQKVTNEEVRQMADRILLEQTVPDKAGVAGTALNWATLGLAGFAGIGVDGTKQVRNLDLPGADRMAFAADQIPSAAREQARAALIRKGIAAPSDDQILTTYNAAIGAQAK